MTTQETARQTLHALAVLSDLGLGELDRLEGRTNLSLHEGEVYFNNEYTIQDSELVDHALHLLAYARKLKKL